MSTANAEQTRYWNEEAGDGWVRNQQRIDARIEPLGAFGLEALAPVAGEAILDVGCGCGASSIALAQRVGPGGRVLGLDLSAPMLARARERSHAARLSNLRFVQGDAERHDFGGERFDALFSRFGVMFFEDPEAAFLNLSRALAPAGRLAFVCWQRLEQNEWVTVPLRAIAKELPLPAPDPDAPGPFAFGDPERVRNVLAAAGFCEINIEARVGNWGGAVEDSADFLLEVGPISRLLREQNADDARRQRVRVLLQEALSAHARSAGPEGAADPDPPLALAAAVWVVTARAAATRGAGAPRHTLRTLTPDPLSRRERGMKNEPSGAGQPLLPLPLGEGWGEGSQG